ncbi:hypothetical protein [Borborobacter arsenicus]|nr:hypothetical protein [Pseudaminobacter arsenicus]
MGGSVIGAPSPMAASLSTRRVTILDTVLALLGWPLAETTRSL